MVEIDGKVPAEARLAFRVLDFYHTQAQPWLAGLTWLCGLPLSDEIARVLNWPFGFRPPVTTAIRFCSFIFFTLSALGTGYLFFHQRKRERTLSSLANLIDQKEEEIATLRRDADNHRQALHEAKDAAAQERSQEMVQRSLAVSRERTQAQAAFEATLRRVQVDHDHHIAELTSRIRSLEADMARWSKEVVSLATGHLSILALDLLQFGSKPRIAERITLYIYDSSGFFVPVGRYASNPKYDGISRSRYPVDHGCVGMAWCGGLHFARDYPNPDQKPKEYIDRCVKDGMDPRIVDAIRMKSRLFYGRKLFGTTKRKGFGVLLVESTHPNRFTRAALDAALGERELRTLAHLAEMLSTNVPRLSEAALEDL